MSTLLRSAIGRALGAVAALTIAGSACAAEAVLKIGVSDALTGGAAVYGHPQANAVRMAAEEINRAGGVRAGDRRYELDVIARDDRGDPNAAVEAVRALIDRDGARYVLGFCCSGATSAVASIIEDEDVVMLVGNAAERSITTRDLDNLTRTRPPADYTGAAAGAFVAARGHRRVAIIGALDVAFYASYAEAFEIELNAAGGDVIARESFSLDDLDMTAQLAQIAELNPDALLVVGYVEPAAHVYRQAHELGLEAARYGFTSGSEEQFLRIASPEQMEGVWDLRPTELNLQAASENAIAYHANYTERFGSAPSPSSPYAYDQLYALRDAIERAGDARDTAAVAKALREIPPPEEAVMPYLTIEGKLFDRNGQAYTTNSAFQWRDGAWVHVEELPSNPEAYSAFLSLL